MCPCCKNYHYIDSVRAYFKTLDGAVRELVVPYPPPHRYVLPICKPIKLKCTGDLNPGPMRLNVTNRQYELRTFDHCRAEYWEVYHECGTEAAVERALIAQKKEFQKKFDELNQQLFAKDSDLKSEPCERHNYNGYYCPDCG